MTIMRCLVLDTALHACTAACIVVDADGGIRTLAERREAMTVGHAEALMPMVADVFDAVGRDGFARIVVTTGPGSFTGLRVALSAARGLGLALGVPAYGVGTLAALAGLGFADAPRGRVASVIDARRGEVYCQPFSGLGNALAAPAIVSIANAEAILAGVGDGPWTLVGSGADLLATPGTRIAAAAPIAADIARLGAIAPETASPPRPLYLRAPDAKRPIGQPIATAETPSPSAMTRAMTEAA